MQDRLCGDVVVKSPDSHLKHVAGVEQKLIAWGMLAFVFARALSHNRRLQMVHRPRRAYPGLFGFLLIGVVAVACGSSDQGGSGVAGGKCTTSQDCAGGACVSGVCQGSSDGGS